MFSKIKGKLSEKKVFDLLQYFDDSSDEPLHLNLDFITYSKKLSDFAHFILILEGDKLMSFLAYYLNDEGRFIYIPQIVVHKDGRHQGLGHQMMSLLVEQYRGRYDCILLEVLKSNANALAFYQREGFEIKEDRNEKYLLVKYIE